MSPQIASAVVAVLLHTREPWRGITYAYELVRSHYSDPDSHIALIRAVGFGGRSPAGIEEPAVTAIGTAVAFRLDGDEVDQWHLLEDSPNPDPSRDEFSPEHPTSKELLGKRPGEEFVCLRNSYQERSGTIREVRSKYRYRVYHSMNRWGILFPGNDFLTQFQLPTDEEDRPDFASIVGILRNQNLREEEIRIWYRDHIVSTSVLAVVSGQDTIRTLQFLIATPGMPVRCCRGTATEFDTGRLVAAGSGPFVADPTALATLFWTGLYRCLASLPFELIISTSSLLEYQRLAEMERCSDSPVSSVFTETVW